jgi:hypothetical protein
MYSFSGRELQSMEDKKAGAPGRLGPPGSAPPTGSGPPAGAGAASPLTRVTVNLTRRSHDALEALSATTGYSKTDTINRALQVYLEIQKLMDSNDGDLRVVGADGHPERIWIV